MGYCYQCLMLELRGKASTQKTFINLDTVCDQFLPFI